MERQEHLDYAAVVGSYHASGTRLSMKEVETLRQDIRELKQQHKEEIAQLREDSKLQSAEQLAEYKKQMQMLNDRLALLDKLAKARELTAEEQKALP